MKPFLLLLIPAMDLAIGQGSDDPRIDLPPWVPNPDHPTALVYCRGRSLGDCETDSVKLKGHVYCCTNRGGDRNYQDSKQDYGPLKWPVKCVKPGGPRCVI